MTETENPKKSKKAAVYALSRSSRCYACDRKLAVDEIVQLKNNDEDREVVCQKCAGLGHLEVLLSGNTKITKLAGKYSTVQFNIMKWSDLWKCYERKGILVEPSAINQAEEELGFKLQNRQGVKG
jgi:hypothetical protein